MVLIFGGAYQGKLTYALGRFELGEHNVYRCDGEDIGMPCGKDIVYEIDKWILALVRAEMDVADNVRKFIAVNEDVAVICNDISCGIVPTDRVLRKWREETGRAMAVLANHSQEVVRLFCGIATKVK